MGDSPTRRRAIKLVRPLEPSLDTLRRVHQRGGTIAICSNNMSATVRSGLDRLGVSHIVTMVVGRDSVCRSKPDPEGLRQILKHLNVDGKRAVFVGDSADDAEAARRAGTSFVKIEDHSLLRETLSPGDTAQALGIGSD